MNERLMERLRVDAADWNGDSYIKKDLREAADAIEQLQKVLPCKVGETVWYLTGKPSLAAHSDFDRVESEEVAGFYWDEKGLQIRLRNFHGNHGTYGFFEKTVFLTSEKAEAALKAQEDEAYYE